MKYFPPRNSVGRPLTPEILTALGLISRYPAPNEPFDPGGNWTHRYQTWTVRGTKSGSIYQGELSLSRRQTGSDDSFVLAVTQVIQGTKPGEQGRHTIEAKIRCRQDALASPVSWNLASRFHDANGNEIPDATSGEVGRVYGRTLVRQINRTEISQPLSGSLASDWGLFEAVQRLPLEPGSPLRFDLLEDLSLVKPHQRLSFVGEREFQLWDATHMLYGFRQHGWGVLPYEYWLDEAHRLVMVINGNRVYILDTLLEERGENRQVATTDSLPTEHESEEVSERPQELRPAPHVVGGSERGSSKPNLLLVFTDQQTLDTIGAGGCPYVNTPALDSLWNRGVRFTESYCSNPLCSPSRGSILTGRMPSETGAFGNDGAIRPDIPNLGQWLSRQADYETVYGGKWHLPETHTYDTPGFRVLAPGLDHRSDVSDALVSRACEAFLLNRTGTNPFLLVVSFLQPHDICDWLPLNVLRKDTLPFPELEMELPDLPPNHETNSSCSSTTVREPQGLRNMRERWLEATSGRWGEADWRYYLWSYYRMVEMVDAEIGRVLRALDNSPYADNTMILFTSDHGEGVAQHRLARKRTMYEAMVKVPLLACWPGYIREGVTDSEHLVSGIDIMPTFCDYASVDPPANTTGRSLRPLLDGTETEWRSFVVMEIGEQPIKTGKARAVRSQRYKYVTYRGDPIEQLFDLEMDPGEMDNLATDSEAAAILEAHRRMLREWEDQLDLAPGVPNADYWRTDSS